MVSCGDDRGKGMGSAGNYRREEGELAASGRAGLGASVEEMREAYGRGGGKERGDLPIGGRSENVGSDDGRGRERTGIPSIFRRREADGAAGGGGGVGADPDYGISRVIGTGMMMGKGKINWGGKCGEVRGCSGNLNGVMVWGGLGRGCSEMTGMGKVYGEVRGGGGMVEQLSGGGGSGGQWRRRRRRRVDCTLGNTRPKQGEAAVSTASTAAARGGAAAVAAAEAAVGLLP